MLSAKLWILHLSIVAAVVLPGPCPQLPPINYSDPLKFANKVILFIPYEEESESLVFKRPPNHPTYCIILISDPASITSRGKSSGFIPTEFLKTSYYVKKRDSIYETTTVLKRNREISNCYPEVKETVHMWLDGDFGFIWSCHENKSKNTHDEALIVHTIRPLYNKEHLSTIIPFYFREQLVNEIRVSLQDGVNATDCNTDVLYPCKSTEPKIGVLWFILLLLVVLFVLVRIVVTMNNTRIYPI